MSIYINIKTHFDYTHQLCISEKTLKNALFFLSLYNLLLAEKDFTQVNHSCNHISSWKLQQKYYWKNKEYQWSSDENWAVHSNIIYVLKRQRKMQLLIITYRKGNSRPGCHQWQCSHFFHLRLQLQILPVKMKEKMFTTLIPTDFPRWQAYRYKTRCLFHLVEVPTRFDNWMEYLLVSVVQFHTIHIHGLLLICCS